MAYSLTRQDIASITDLDIAFGTTRLLPLVADIPEGFTKQNIYTNIVDALFANLPVPAGTMTFNQGFADDKAAADMMRCIRAHLVSFEPKHEHKVAGVAYMISQICTISPGE